MRQSSLLVLALLACGPRVDPPDAGGPIGGGSAGGTVDSGSVDAGVVEAGTDSGVFDAGQGTVRVIQDLTLPGFRHEVDVYLPSNAVRAIVYLHGGGGTKEFAAERESGIRLDSPPRGTPMPDVAWLLATRSAWVFPQGQNLQGMPAHKTWSNYSMTSGVDDVAFLQALSTALRAGSLSNSVPAFSRLYLAGHSNGGMMAQRQWCEAPSSYDGFGGVAGPPSVELLPNGPHPCSPDAGRPYVAMIGDSDTVVQTKDNWDGGWSVNMCLRSGAGAAMPNPMLANEEVFHAKRASTLCQAAMPSAPVTTRSSIEWSDCAGRTKLIRVIGADHCVAATTSDLCVGGGAGGGCMNSLDGIYGTRVRDVLSTFFTSLEP